MAYPYEIREEQIGNLELKLVGVKHILSDFEKNKEFFTNEIDNSNLIFFEDGLGSKFYRNLRSLALEKCKDKYYIPDSGGYPAINSEVVVGFGGLALIKSALNNSLINKKELSRKDFLKKIGLFAGGIYLLSNLAGYAEDFSQGVVGPDAVVDNALSYNTIQDFRNIVSASNIIKGEKVLEFSGKGVYFIGEKHVNGISAYLRNPKLLKKRILYVPQDLLFKTPLREYQFLEDRWKLTNSI